MAVKIAIVEDQSPAMQNVKSKILAFDPLIEIVVEAADGRSAIPLLLDAQPDIVFTDIHMPHLDGLQMIEGVKAQLPDTFFVIFSGSDNFQYAQKAMSLGVFDYLLKPVSQEAVQNVLTRLTARIAERRHEAALRYFSQLVRFNQSDISLELCDFNCASYQPLLLCLGSYYLYNVSYNGLPNAVFRAEDVAASLQTHAPQQAFWCVPAQYCNTFFMVLGWSDGENPHGEAIARIMMDSLCAGISGEPFPVTVVLGKLHSQCRSCGAEYPLLSLTLRQQQVFGQASIQKMDACPGYVHSRDRGFVLAAKRFADYFESNEKDLFFTELKAQLDLWSSIGCTQHQLQRELKQMVKCLQSTMKERDTADYDLEIDELLSLSQEYQSLWSGLRTILEVLWNTRYETLQTVSIAEVVQNLEIYIDVHYMEQITINDLAVSAGYTPAYLSRQYKKIKHVSPMEHLTEMRIRKACSLLESCPSLKLKQVGELSGYENQLYFSRIFKETIGMSPSEYKARVNVSDEEKRNAEELCEAGMD